MKRIVISILILFCCIATFVSLWWISDPVVHWSKVNNKLKGNFGRSDHDVSHDRSWISAWVRNNPKRYYLEWKRSRIGVTTGFPNGGMGFHSYEDNYNIVLSVHLYDNLARGITISYDSGGKTKAEEVQMTLNKAFPHLPTRVIERNAQHQV